MPLEDFKAHLRTIAGEDPKAEIISPARPNPMLVRNSGSRQQRQSEGDAEGWGLSKLLTFGQMGSVTSAILPRSQSAAGGVREKQ